MSKNPVQSGRDKFLFWLYTYIARTVDNLVNRGVRGEEECIVLRRLIQSFGDGNLLREMAWARASQQEPGIFLAERLWGASWRRSSVIQGCWQDFLKVCRPGATSIPALPCEEEELRSAVEEHGLFPVYIPPSLALRVAANQDSGIFAQLAELFSFHDSVTHELIQREKGGESSHYIESWNDNSLHQSGWLWVEADLEFPPDKARSLELLTMYPGRTYPFGDTQPMSVLTFVVFFQFLRYILGDSVLDGDGYTDTHQTVFPNIVSSLRLPSSRPDMITLSWRWKMLHYESWYSCPANAQSGGMRSVIPMGN